MTQGNTPSVFARIDQWEVNLCRTVNKVTRFPLITGYFRMVSGLGKDWFWYGLILLLPVLAGAQGLVLGVTLTLASLLCTMIHRGLKQKLVRERPFVAFPVISCGTPPLERYSFPSGTALHAACFTTVLLLCDTTLGLIVLPFTLSVMASRVILGMHYPSDVLAGTLIGITLGVAIRLMLPIIGDLMLIH